MHEVADWIQQPQHAPKPLLLAIPGAGGTTVRYARNIDADGCWDYHPDGGRWGIPISDRVHDHPALGCCLTETRKGTEVQVLAGYSSGVRVFEM